jgi:hypothetical protein
MFNGQHIYLDSYRRAERDLKLSKHYGQRITSATMTEEQITLALENGKRIAIRDDGQSCCEHRYMTTDDDIQSLVGHLLIRIEEKPGPGEGDDSGEHETVFVEIATETGFVTIVNHNEHNGYYGGFSVGVSEVEDDS